jgi:hypothetical protein
VPGSGAAITEVALLGHQAPELALQRYDSPEPMPTALPALARQLLLGRVSAFPPNVVSASSKHAGDASLS